MDPTGEAMNYHLNYPPVKTDCVGSERPGSVSKKKGSRKPRDIRQSWRSEKPRRNPPAGRNVDGNLKARKKSKTLYVRIVVVFPEMLNLRTSRRCEEIVKVQRRVQEIGS
jgi:hypothetical protein